MVYFGEVGGLSFRQVPTTVPTNGTTNVLTLMSGNSVMDVSLRRSNVDFVLSDGVELSHLFTVYAY